MKEFACRPTKETIVIDDKGKPIGVITTDGSKDYGKPKPKPVKEIKTPQPPPPGSQKN